MPQDLPMGDLDLINDTSYLIGVEPYLRADIEKMKAATATRVYAEITNGRFTPERAYTAWLEMHAYNRLMSRFSTKIRTGTDAAVAHAQQLTLGV